MFVLSLDITSVLAKGATCFNVKVKGAVPPFILMPVVGTEESSCYYHALMNGKKCQTKKA